MLHCWCVVRHVGGLRRSPNSPQFLPHRTIGKNPIPHVLSVFFETQPRVHGDVVWVKARAEEQVLAILEGDRELLGEEAKAADLLKSGR